MAIYWCVGRRTTFGRFRIFRHVTRELADTRARSHYFIRGGGLCRRASGAGFALFAKCAKELCGEICVSACVFGGQNVLVILKGNF